MAHDVENELRGWLSAYLDPAVLRPDAASQAVAEGRRRLRRRRAVAGGGVAVALATTTPFAIDWFGARDSDGTTAFHDSTPSPVVMTATVTTSTESPTVDTQTPVAETPLRMVTRTADDPPQGLFASLGGTLVVTDDGCLAVAADDGQSTTGVVWGYGWTAQWEDGVVVVRDPTGAAFARTGERVHIAGGGGSSREDSQAAAIYADQLCGVDGFWSANDEP